MRRQSVIVTSLLIVVSFVAALSATAQDAPGVPNFHEVNPHLYRGAQPQMEGYQSLSKLGIRTIIDLRGGGEQGRSEQKLVESAGMHYVHVPMAGLSAPTEPQISTLLGILDDPTAWPIFVHCKRGADRTGTVIACYRIRHDHWENQKALEEARLNGMSWLEHAMQQFVLHFDPKAATPPPGGPPAPASP